MKVVKQTSKDTYWTNEKGYKIPYSRLTKIEKSKETKTYSLLKKSQAISNSLAEFKKAVQLECEELYRKEMEQLKADPNKPPKGNYTFYNFDQSIRIKVSISEPVKFSDAALEAAKQHFDKYIEDTVTTTETFMKDSIRDAFATKNGHVDPGKIFNLLSYKSKTKNQDYIMGCDALEQGSTRPSSKTYYQISFKNEDGDFENVELNFSKI